MVGRPSGIFHGAIVKVGVTRGQPFLERLLTGDVVSYELKLIEGWTVTEALAALAAHP